MYKLEVNDGIENSNLHFVDIQWEPVAYLRRRLNIFGARVKEELTIFLSTQDFIQMVKWSKPNGTRKIFISSNSPSYIFSSFS